MPFSGLDDMIAEMALGKKHRQSATRIVQTGATSVAGRWHECFTTNGTGGIGVLSGTAGVGAERNGLSPGAIPMSPRLVTPDTRQLTAMMAVTPAATMVPGICRLIDILYVYPQCNVATGAGTTLNNAAAKPARFDNGRDVKVGAIVTGALGAASPVLTLTYTDQDGNTGNTGLLAASANSLPVGVFLAGSPVSGVLGGPDMLMAAGDGGVRQIDSYTVATGTTGTVALILYRDLGDVPIIAANVAGERDFLTQIPSMPIIPDDACCSPIVLIGGALVTNSPILLTTQTAWG